MEHPSNRGRIGAVGDVELGRDQLMGQVEAGVAFDRRA
jgi:hypothetical protein